MFAGAREESLHSSDSEDADDGIDAIIEDGDTATEAQNITMS